MKKLMLASATVLSFASVSQATIDTVNKSGFYIGVNGGYGFEKVKMFNKHVKMKGLIGGGHLGYQHDVGRFVVGVELGADFPKMQKNVKNVGFKDIDIEKNETETLTTTTIIKEAKLTRKHGFTAALRFGHKIAPCWVAGVSLGYAHAHHTIKLAGDKEVMHSTLSHSFRDPEASVKVNAKVKTNGFTPGIYVEKLLQKHVMVGLAYNYGFHKIKKDKKTDNISFKPQTHDIKVRLGYKF